MPLTSELIENSYEEDCSSKLSPIDDDNSNSSTTTCPVCQKILFGDNDKINQHIDLCLNGEVIRTTIKEEDQRVLAIKGIEPINNK